MMLFDAALSEGLKIINKWIPDKDAQAKAAAEYNDAMLAADTQLALSQNEVNKVEASNSNLFVSGWRPFIGWICGCALAYHFILQPLLAFLCALFGYTIALPIFNMDSLMTLLFGLLGLGAMRTFEKTKGVTK